MGSFSFSLQCSAKGWLHYLQPNYIKSWNDVKKLFLKSFFLFLRAALIRKVICEILKIDRESWMSESWERFKKLLCSYYQHQISEQLSSNISMKGCHLWIEIFKKLLLMSICRYDPRSGNLKHSNSELETISSIDKTSQWDSSFFYFKQTFGE